MKIRKHIDPKTIILFGFIAVFLFGCDLLTSADDRVSRAQAYQAELNHQAAIIELKKVLESDSTHAQARLLLGDSYSWLGQWANAEKEYRRAADLGLKTVESQVALGRALLAQNRFQPTLDVLPEGESVAPEVQSVRGEAYIASNQSDKAKALYTRLFANDDSKLLGAIGLAKTELADGRQGNASAYIAQALEADSNSIEALLIKAQLEFMSMRFDQSEQAFSKIISLGGDALPRVTRFSVLGGLVETQLQQVKHEKARENIAILAKQFPGHPRTKYFMAMMAYDDKKYEATRDHLQAILKVAPDFLPAQILMGAVNFQLGHYEQADTILTSVLATNPGNKEIRKLLVATRLRQGQTQEAMAALDPSIESVSGDSDLLLMASRAKMQSGDREAGIELLEQGAEQFPQNTQIQMGLAGAYISAGQLDRAISSLNSLVTENDEAHRRNAMLVFAHVQNNEPEKALEFLEALLKKEPKNANAHVLMAAVYSIKTVAQHDKASEHFNKALAIDAKNTGALMGLGRVALSNGDLKKAAERFEQVSEVNPKQLNALFALAHIADRNKQSDEVLKWLLKAVDVNPDAAKAKRVLFRYLSKKEDYSGLETQARRLIEHNGKDTISVNALVLALVKQGKLDDALTAATQASKLQPEEPSFYYSAGRVQFEKGDLKSAKEGYEKVLSLNPSHQAAVMALVELDEKEGNVDQALKRLDDYQKHAPKNIFSFLLRSNVLQRQGELDQALHAIKQAIGLEPENFVLLSKQFQIKRALRDDSIVNDLNNWLQRHPEDSRAKFMLAEYYQQSGENDKAIGLYEEVVATQAENFVALNNLAWLYHVKKDKRDLPTAESAYKLKSDDASVEDTLGWIMINRGQLDRGVELLQSAASRVPNVADIQYHLAYGLYKQGHGEQAKPILKQLINSDKKFSYANEAKSLYQSL